MDISRGSNLFLLFFGGKKYKSMASNFYVFLILLKFNRIIVIISLYWDIDIISVFRTQWRILGGNTNALGTTNFIKLFSPSSIAENSAIR